MNNKLFSINLLEKPKTVYIRTYMTQRFTAYLVRMRRIQRADYSTTMHNSDIIFIAAWAAHQVAESLLNFIPQQAKEIYVKGDPTPIWKIVFD